VSLISFLSGSSCLARSVMPAYSQAVFIHDFPRHPSVRCTPLVGDFAKQLDQTLGALDVGRGARSGLEKYAVVDSMFSSHALFWKLTRMLGSYDFTAADSRYRLIFSKSGTYSGARVSDFGHPSVVDALRKLDAKIDDSSTLHLECQASCRGLYSPET
jgi:Tyrosyl-DNA phosphodiesterase